MRALVIGGTRFIGLHLVRALAEAGHEITLLNRGKTQAALPAGLERLYADRRDPEGMQNALAGRDFDAVFDMSGYQLRSVAPVVEILAGRIGHYLFQSTAGVYAGCETLPIREDFPTVDPSTRLSGAAAYGNEKVQCEQFLIQAYRERGFPVTIFRAPVIYGPDNWMHDREFSFFVRLTDGLPVLVPGNGNTFLPFVHVDDVARAHLAAASSARACGEAYNLNGAEAITINGYLDVIGELVGATPRKIYLDWSVMEQVKGCVFPFRSEKSGYYAIEKAKEHLGWQPQYDIKSGLSNTYEWWRETLGVAKTRFNPGTLGYDVDLAYEAELAKRHGG